MFIIAVGRRRIFRPDVIRTTDSIICRYVPWYEGNNYFLCLLLPLMGVALIAAGRDSDNPAWLQFGGIVLLCLMPLFLHSIINMWRRCVLHISPSALTLRLGMPGSELTEIRRDQIVSITPMIVTTGPNKSLQTQIVYHPVTGETETILLGLQLTVRPIDLANALMSWNDADVDDPDELLDLIERVLRGGRPAIPVKPPQDRSDHD
ncbi:hypothetical protein [Mycolicibacter acidiphilus]|uniref:hypothetical protein n=1 Tax=Mycolicibacter acidiphilus TaxID=2835306 RepID=UPI0027DE0981|nr:hypothetical protein [Mycolicibacter acidiphilus]